MVMGGEKISRGRREDGEEERKGGGGRVITVHLLPSGGNSGSHTRL